jgi:hypothetical protein
VPHLDALSDGGDDDFELLAASFKIHDGEDEEVDCDPIRWLLTSVEDIHNIKNAARWAPGQPTDEGFDD